MTVPDTIPAPPPEVEVDPTPIRSMEGRALLQSFKQLTNTILRTMSAHAKEHDDLLKSIEECRRSAAEASRVASESKSVVLGLIERMVAAGLFDGKPPTRPRKKRPAKKRAK
jgi:hypothetical protein